MSDLLTSVFNVETLAAFITLAALEIVLGIDNIIFLSITASKLPSEQQGKARTLGLAGAMLTRILLLLSLAWLAKLTAPLFTVLGIELSGRDLILLIGGLFLIGKSTLEVHEQFDTGETDAQAGSGKAARFWSAIVQIMILDIVFSLDSVITAVGMTDQVGVMIAAIVSSVIVMMFFSGAVSRFVDNNPTIKTLALSFLILIGTSLVAESLDFHLPKGYVYFAMAFSLVVEVVNLQLRKRSK
jgi:predicted tellurium resistance membrane protein TerC